MVMSEDAIQYKTKKIVPKPRTIPTLSKDEAKEIAILAIPYARKWNWILEPTPIRDNILNFKDGALHVVSVTPDLNVNVFIKIGENGAETPTLTHNHYKIQEKFREWGIVPDFRESMKS